MQKKLTITIDEAVYNGLHSIIGRGNISHFLEELARPHVINSSLIEGYKAMAADQEREKEAREWSEGLIRDIPNETW